MSYVFGNKIWLNSKYIKIKWNCKLEAKFFKLFQVRDPVGNQVYKLELAKKWRIYNIFYKFLLEHDTIKKQRIDKTTTQLKFKTGSNGNEYKFRAIQNSILYARK